MIKLIAIALVAVAASAGPVTSCHSASGQPDPPIKIAAPVSAPASK